VTAVHWQVTGGGLTGLTQGQGGCGRWIGWWWGGGVLGMMHAIEARQRGYHVVHLERVILCPGAVHTGIAGPHLAA
jgi:hypothetical protein